LSGSILFMFIGESRLQMFMFLFCSMLMSCVVDPLMVYEWVGVLLSCGSLTGSMLLTLYHW
jgi:hypothetical protein